MSKRRRLDRHAGSAVYLRDSMWVGVGMALTFTPVLAIFFAVQGVMEDTGCIARAAYVTEWRRAAFSGQMRDNYSK